MSLIEVTSAAYAADPLLDIEFTWSDFGNKMKSKLGDLVQASLVFNPHPRLPVQCLLPPELKTGYVKTKELSPYIVGVVNSHTLASFLAMRLIQYCLMYLAMK